MSERKIRYIGGRVIFRNLKEANKLAVRIFNKAVEYECKI